VNIRSRFRHADKGFIFNEIKFVFIHTQEFHIIGLGRAAARAGFYRAGVFGFTIGANPYQGDKTKRFSGHHSSVDSFYQD
jgi:hypothetical protein